MIKGKVKVEIKDAITGEIKDTREETNMLTNSVFNIINGATARARRGNYNPIQLGTSTEDIIRMLFGGIMVFSRNIDTTHLVPDPIEAERMIGCGNQQGTISGSGIKGNLRSAVVTEDSAEFIWDFAATQCNGQIASICLTSNKGGELGNSIEARDASRKSDSFVYAYEDSLGFDKENALSASYPRTNIIELQAATSNKGLRVFDGDTIAFYYGSDKYTWNLSKYKNRFDMNESQTTKIVVPYEKESGQTSTAGLSLVQGPMTDYALMGKCIYETSGSSTTYTLQLVKCTKNSQSGVNVPMNNIITAIQALYERKGYDNITSPATIANNITASLAQTCFTFNNKLIWLVGSYNNSGTDFLVIYIQDFDGSYVVLDQIQEDTTFYNLIDKANMQYFKGTLLNMSGSPKNTWFTLSAVDNMTYLTVNDYYFFLSINQESDWGIFLDNRPNFYIKGGKTCFSRLIQDELAPYPYYRALGDAYGGASKNHLSWCVNSLLRTNYLATIQNQSNPAVKTPSDIMSITYTLTRQN